MRLGDNFYFFLKKNMSIYFTDTWHGEAARGGVAGSWPPAESSNMCTGSFQHLKDIPFNISFTVFLIIYI